MNVQTDRLSWQDLACVAEEHPGLLRDVALLRRHLQERGPVTLLELLQWQAAPRPSPLGRLPVNETGFDRLSIALKAASDGFAELRVEHDRVVGELAHARGRLGSLDKDRAAELANALRDFANDIDPEGDPRG